MVIIRLVEGLMESEDRILIFGLTQNSIASKISDKSAILDDGYDYSLIYKLVKDNDNNDQTGRK